MRNLIIMFVIAVCFLFLLKLKWPKNMNFFIEQLVEELMAELERNTERIELQRAIDHHLQIT